MFSVQSTMEWFPLSAVFVLLLSTAWTSSPDYQHQNEIALHHHHVSYIADFHCHYPQPRVIRLKHLLTEHETHGKAYFPDVTVLHLCDDGCGSCPPEQACGPLHSDFIRLPFKVTFLEDTSFHKQGSWAWEHHDIANHTVCACYPLREDGRDPYLKAADDTDLLSDRLGYNKSGDEGKPETLSTNMTTDKPKESSLVFID